MKTILGLTTAMAAAMAATVAGAATLGNGSTAYALGDEGTTLVRISGSGIAGAVALTFEGTPPASLDGIDYRPATGEFYGYDDRNDAVYRIDAATGITTRASLPAAPEAKTQTSNLDVDFNPVVDAMRIVTGQNENNVFTPNRMGGDMGTLAPQTDLAYAGTDAQVGENPFVVFNAYTNAVAGATATSQFVIDTELDTLATLANATGVLATLGRLTIGGALFDATENGGFDILSFAEGDNSAFALLTNGITGLQSIYSLALAADRFGNVELTKVADLSNQYGPLDGFTVAPSAVPVPAAGLLLIGALGSLAALRRRRRAA